jgi:hypothetical protein
MATTIDGMIAIRRVTRRRTIGFIYGQKQKNNELAAEMLTETRHCKKPSQTAWPATVAIREELWNETGQKRSLKENDKIQLT